METADWKTKAIERTKEIKQLKKTIKEIKCSRDDWKEKSIAHKQRADKLASDLKKIKDGLNQIMDI